MPAPPPSGGHGGKPRAETLLQAATWLKWLRDGRPGLPASTDELNDVIKILEDTVWHGLVVEDQS
jgi:hypothetical protein